MADEPIDEAWLQALNGTPSAQESIAITTALALIVAAPLPPTQEPAHARFDSRTLELAWHTPLGTVDVWVYPDGTLGYRELTFTRYGSTWIEHVHASQAAVLQKIIATCGETEPLAPGNPV